MELVERVSYEDFRREYVLKLIDYDLSEIVFAAENKEEFQQWIQAFKDVKEDIKER